MSNDSSNSITECIREKNSKCTTYHSRTLHSTFLNNLTLPFNYEGFDDRLRIRRNYVTNATMNCELFNKEFVTTRVSWKKPFEEYIVLGSSRRRDRRKTAPDTYNPHTYKLGRYFITEGSMKTIERDVPLTLNYTQAMHIHREVIMGLGDPWRMYKFIVIISFQKGNILYKQYKFSGFN